MIISIIPMSIITASAATSGTCGENLTWTFDEETGTLTISGIGDMYGYSYGMGNSTTPWKNSLNNIKNLVIEDGVTTIGNYAFSNCDSLTSVTIPNSVTKIELAAFEYTNLTDVYYSCTEKQWNEIIIDNTEDSNAPLHNATKHFSGHSNTWVTLTDATCEKDGVLLGTCSNCESIKVDYTDATGHNMVNGDCTNCDYTENTENEDNNEVIDPSVECDCNCHKSGISKFFFDFALFFQKIFGSNKYCSCGVAHY